MREKKDISEGRKSGSSGGRKKEWPYFASLAFLQPLMTSRPTSSNINLPSSQLMDIGEDDEEENYQLPPPLPTPSPTLSSLAPSTFSSPPSQKRKLNTAASMSPLEVAIEGYLKKQSNIAPPPPEDDDLMYFKSLMPLFKRLPEPVRSL